MSRVYPALARVSAERFGISVVATAGAAYEAGDAQVPFPIMGVAKPFVFALVSEAIGAEEVRRRIGVNATGMALNSLDAVEVSPDGRTNPMVNAGAIATTSLVSGNTLEERYGRIEAHSPSRASCSACATRAAGGSLIEMNTVSYGISSPSSTRFQPADRSWDNRLTAVAP